MKRLSAAIAVLVVLVATSPVAAVGRPVFHFNDRIDETIPDDPSTTDDDLCGVLPVTTHIVGHQSGSLRLDKAGHLVFRASGRFTTTWTNPATGLWVSNTVSGTFRDIRVVDNPDGSTTIINANNGVPERLVSSNGTLLVKDRGRIVFATTIHFHDPDDPTDDEFISAEIVKIAGPHPEAESGFTLFCEVVVDALT